MSAAVRSTSETPQGVSGREIDSGEPPKPQLHLGSAADQRAGDEAVPGGLLSPLPRRSVGMRALQNGYQLLDCGPRLAQPMQSFPVPVILAACAVFGCSLQPGTRRCYTKSILPHAC